MQRRSYLDGDAGPDPSDLEVYASQCDADCYAKAFEDFELIEGLDPQYQQQANAACESAWRAKQALDYEFYSSGFLYEGLLPERANLPQWLQDELNTIQTNPVDETEIDATLAECRTCNPSASAGDVPPREIAVIGSSPALAPIPAVAVPPVVNLPPEEAAAATEDIPMMPSPSPVVSPSPLPSPSPSDQVESAGYRVHHHHMTVVATTLAILAYAW